eukprot:TRINITY_DN19871_c0_g2_i1.p1 TRINITY_DN19871_c0_g2~~TRINITY_DN19871_c0_g2_i1.p1  ORF type:complete len:162 (+),score=55.87 TRINITY_DN19871_c0_g2_i1:67-552(+)
MAAMGSPAKRGGLSRDFKRYEEAFRKMSNRKELLSVDSLADMLRLTGACITPDELDALIPEYNVNGFVNFASVLDILARLEGGDAKERHREEIIDFFRLLDEYNTGFVYVSELRQALVVAGDALREKEFDHLMHTQGLAGREKLSLYEFTHVLLQPPRDLT